MLYAAIVHCPIFGGTPKTINESAIAEMKGVRRVVRLPNAVAVIADSWWRAKRAVEALPIEWDPRGNGNVSSAGLADIVRAGLSAEKSQVGRADGDVAAAMQSAVKHVEADYEVPFLAHATMEPQTCTAHVTKDGVEVWVPSQEPMTALATAASAAGVPNDKVVVHGTFLGGGFGRRARHPGVRSPSGLDRQRGRRPGQAAVVARAGHQARLLSAVRHGAPRRRPRRGRHAGVLVGQARRAVLRARPCAGLRHDVRRSHLHLRPRRGDGLRGAELSGGLRGAAVCRCRSVFGARSITRRTPSTKNRSSTRWRMRPAWIPISIVAICCATTPRTWRRSTPRRNTPIGSRRRRRACIAASR